MASFLNPAISIGPVVFCLGLLFALACLLIHLFGSASRKETSLLRYLLVVFATGVVAFFGGTFLGIAAFCLDASSGNLCGLGGVFGIGPLLSGVCMAGYGYLWLRDARSGS